MWKKPYYLYWIDSAGSSGEKRVDMSLSLCFRVAGRMVGIKNKKDETGPSGVWLIPPITQSLMFWGLLSPL